MAGEAVVKAQDELAALGLDDRLASQKEIPIRAKKNITMNLPNHKMSSHRPAFSWKAKSLIEIDFAPEEQDR
jgi:hypothetical protein